MNDVAARTRPFRLLLVWLVLATVERMFLFGRLHREVMLGGRRATLAFDDVRTRLFALADGFATDLVSFLLFVGPLLLLATLLAPRARRASRAAAMAAAAPLGAMTVLLLFNAIAAVHTGGPIDAGLIERFHDVRGALSFLRIEAGGVLPVATILAAALATPGVLARALRPVVPDPGPRAARAALLLSATCAAFVVRVATGASIRSLRGRMQLAAIREYEDPSWRLLWAGVEASRLPVRTGDLSPGERVALRPLLTPGDDAPPIDPAFPLFRRWKAVGTRTIGWPARSRPPNVVIVFLESNSASDVGALGDDGGNTPRFDALAADGWSFSRFYSNGTFSEAGFFATMFSMYGYLDPSGEPLPPAAARGSLVDVLGRRGWHAGFVVNHDTTWPALHVLAAGMDVQPVEPGAVGWGDDRAIFGRALAWVAAAPRPYLLAVFTATHHGPWTIPDPSVPTCPRSDEWSRSRCALRFQDAQLGGFMDAMRRQPDFDDTLFVLLGDHGSHVKPEGISFLGGLGEEAIHVPALLYAPAWMPRGRSDDLATQVDVAPTIVDALGIDDAEASFVGRSLLRSGSERGFASATVGDTTLALLAAGLKVVYREYSGETDAYALGTDDPVDATDDAQAARIAEMRGTLLQIDRDSRWLLERHAVAPPE